MCSISVESACIRLMQLHLENVFFSIVPKTVICIERALKHRLLLRVVLVGPCLENLLGFASLVPRPIFPTAAGGLHHRYVESGSGK